MAEPNPRRTFAAFLTDFVCAGIAMSAVSVVTYLPLYLKTNGASNLVIGLVPAVATAGRMSGLLVAPLLEARPLIRGWMVGAMQLERLFISLCGAWILVGPDHRPQLMVAGVLVLWVLFNVVSGWTSTAWGAFGSRTLEPSRRAAVHGIGSALSAPTSLVVVPLVGLAIARYGLQQGYGGAFLAAGILMMISCQAFRLAPEEPSPHVRERLSLAGHLRHMMPILRADRRFRWFLVTMMLYLVGSTGSAYFTVYAIERFAVGTSAVTGFTVAMSLGAGASGLVAGRAVRVIGFVRILLVGLVLTAGAMATAAAAQTAGWLYVTFFLTGAGGVAASMAFINLPLELGERTDAPTYFAVAFLVRGPAGALAPVAAGLYLNHYPHPPLYMFCAVVSLAAAGLLQRFVHEAPHSPTPSPPPRPSA